MEVSKPRLYDSPHPLPSGQIYMPTYEYVCKSCGDTIEVFQSFSDKPLKRHDSCGGDLQKVFHARGVVFKGSGFYSTDARASKCVEVQFGACSQEEGHLDQGVDLGEVPRAFYDQFLLRGLNPFPRPGALRTVESCSGCRLRPGAVG